MSLLFLLLMLTSASCGQLSHLSAEKEGKAVIEPASPLSERLNDPYALFLYATLAEADGDYVSAHSYLAKAVSIDPRSAYLHAKMAYLLKEKKEFGEAIKHALVCIELEPSDPEYKVLAGDLHAAMGEDDKAIEQYEQASKLTGGDPRIRMLLSTMLIRKGRFEEALKHLERVIEANPQLIIAHYYRGRVNFELKRIPQAEEAFLQALELNERLEPALYDLGTLYQMAGRDVDAIETYERLLSFHPQNLAVRERLVSLYMKTGLKDKAEREIDAIKGLSQPGGINRQALGLAYLRQGRLDESIEELSMIVSAWPRDYKSRYYLAIAYEEKGDGEKAIENFSTIVPESDYYFNARIHMAYLLEAEKKIDEAIRTIQEALEEKKDKVELYLALGSLYESSKNYAKAKEALRQGLEIDKENTDLMFRLAVILDKDNDKHGCIELMKRVVALNPEHAEALNYIGYTYSEQGVNLEEALALVNRALKIKPESGYIIDSLGWIYYQKAQYAQAIKHLEKAADLMPEDPTISEHLGDAYSKAGRYKDALGRYNKAMSLEPSNPEKLKEKISEMEKRLEKVK
ncbi:tetratricopeptide repeat protein [bacterium]|nr:tetratricopeptide repeat protein [bacterium]NCP08374.1 tetratricopeptide repeat protein [bacterium]OIP37909.1 MAG: hypothetical protein AUK25_13905 [Desulfobacteraceae bacterium CG2_30_51_40]